METTRLSEQCTCRWYGVTIPGEPQMGTMHEAEPDPYCAEHFPPRWKLACINWTSPAGIPHAATYLLVGGEAHVSRYHETWSDAAAWLDKNGEHLERWGRVIQDSERRSNGDPS